MSRGTQRGVYLNKSDYVSYVSIVRGIEVVSAHVLILQLRVEIATVLPLCGRLLFLALLLVTW